MKVVRLISLFGLFNAVVNDKSPVYWIYILPFEV